MSLAAAAAVTERIRLMPSILIAPYHTNTALLAKTEAEQNLKHYCDELVFIPASADPEQADLLAEAMGLGR